MILARVTIYQCDLCPTTFASKCDEDFAKFERTWHAGLFEDFCPTCANLPEAVSIMTENLERVSQIAAELEKPAGLQI